MVKSLAAGPTKALRWFSIDQLHLHKAPPTLVANSIASRTMSVLLRMALTDEPVHDTVFWIDRPRPHMTRGGTYGDSSAASDEGRIGLRPDTNRRK